MSAEPRDPADRNDPAASTPADAQDAERKPREYGHSSGDRNTRTREDEWHQFKGGDQREAGGDNAIADDADAGARRPAGSRD